jgi:hypothetical protein
MALSKIQAESMNLADTYAFTGTVSGASDLVKLSTVTISGTDTTNIDFNNLFTSDYDIYKIYFDRVTAVTDNAFFICKIFYIGWYYYCW